MVGLDAPSSSSSACSCCCTSLSCSSACSPPHPLAPPLLPCNGGSPGARSVMASTHGGMLGGGAHSTSPGSLHSDRPCHTCVHAHASCRCGNEGESCCTRTKLYTLFLMASQMVSEAGAGVSLAVRQFEGSAVIASLDVCPKARRTFHVRVTWNGRR